MPKPRQSTSHHLLQAPQAHPASARQLVTLPQAKVAACGQGLRKPPRTSFPQTNGRVHGSTVSLPLRGVSPVQSTVAQSVSGYPSISSTERVEPEANPRVCLQRSARRTSSPNLLQRTHSPRQEQLLMSERFQRGLPSGYRVSSPASSQSRFPVPAAIKTSLLGLSWQLDREQKQESEQDQCGQSNSGMPAQKSSGFLQHCSSNIVASSPHRGQRSSAPQIVTIPVGKTTVAGSACQAKREYFNQDLTAETSLQQGSGGSSAQQLNRTPKMTFRRASISPVAQSRQLSPAAVSVSSWTTSEKLSRGSCSSFEPAYQPSTDVHSEFVTRSDDLCKTASEPEARTVRTSDVHVQQSSSAHRFTQPGRQTAEEALRRPPVSAVTSEGVNLQSSGELCEEKMSPRCVTQKKEDPPCHRVSTAPASVFQCRVKRPRLELQSLVNHILPLQFRGQMKLDIASVHVCHRLIVIHGLRLALETSKLNLTVEITFQQDVLTYCPRMTKHGQAAAAQQKERSKKSLILYIKPSV